MATYNKRGYRTPKEKLDENGFIENVEEVDESESTTAGVFSSLDETASKTEAWVAKNQKYIFILVGAVAILTVGYVLYQKFIVEPKEADAAEQMFTAQQNFDKALNGTSSDSLFTLALNGSEGKFGFVKIAEEYSGTDAANLSHYYAGIAYLNLGKYDEAIASLKDFSTKEVVLNALSKGAIGDAYAQKNQNEEALDYYQKAANVDKNDFTTPRFLLKAGKIALTLGKNDEAFKHFTEIKESYKKTPEANSVDALIGLSQK